MRECIGNASGFSKVLGAFLTHYLDPQKGGSWASQQFLATHLGVDIRTIRRATSELVAKGHIALEVSRGRGNYARWGCEYGTTATRSL